MRAPVPRSTFPVYSVRRPFGCMTRKESTAAGSTVRCTMAPASGAAIAGAKAKLTQRPAPTLRKSRRARAIWLISIPRPENVSRAHHGTNDAGMSATSTEIGGETVTDVLFGRAWRCRKQRCRLHDHAVGTVGALPGLLGDEGGLHRMRLSLLAQSFEGYDRMPRGARDGKLAGAYRVTVHQNRAGAALAEPAAEFWPTQVEVVAQGIKQRHVGIVGIDAVRLAVDLKRECRHACYSQYFLLRSFVISRF